MSNWQPIEPPSGTWLVTVDEAATTAIDAYTGGFGGFILNKWAPSRYHLRKERFYEDVANGLNFLHGQGKVDRQKLESHEQFISNYAEAVISAIGTHDEEKRAALRNAVLNTAIGNVPDETRQQIFMRWITELMPLHMHLLADCKRTSYSPGRLNQVLKLYPTIAELGIAEVMENDLVSRNLIRPNKTSGVTYLNQESWTTPLGNEFLSFIGDPLEPSAPGAE